MSRLSISKRNALIADFNDGKEDPDYEYNKKETIRIFKEDLKKNIVKKQKNLNLNLVKPK